MEGGLPHAWIGKTRGGRRQEAGAEKTGARVSQRAASTRAGGAAQFFSARAIRGALARKGGGGEKEKERVRRAAEMLLSGATLLGHPCPYCGGVRVIKDGDALCVSCGQEPERRDVPTTSPQSGGSDAGDHAGAEKTDARAQLQGQRQRQRHNLIDVLEKKLESLAGELESETDRQREIAILDSIEGVLSALEKARGVTDGGGNSAGTA